jgi:hypothetical protein
VNQQLTRQLAAEFGATPERLNKLRQTPFPQATKDLAELQREAKAAYKQLAFKYHPDRNPDDPEGAAEKFKLLPQVLREIENLRVAPRRRPQRQRLRRVVFVPGFGFGVGTGPGVTTSTTGPMGYGQVINATNAGPTSTTNTYDARKVTFIKIF